MHYFTDLLIKLNKNPLVFPAVALLWQRNWYKIFLLPNLGKQTPWKMKIACLTISFDCDYPKDIQAFPKLIKIFTKYPFKTSFACVGKLIEQYPDEHKLIVEHGHEIINHTYSHPDNEIINPYKKFNLLSRKEKIEEIIRCDEVCKKILDISPIGFRAPHFKNLFSNDIYSILRELRYIYCSSTLLTNTYSNGMPFFTSEGIIEFPLSTCPRHPLTVFDTWHSFNSPHLLYRLGHSKVREYIDLFKYLLEVARRTHSYINIYIDPADLLKIKDFERLLDFIVSLPDDIEVLTYREIAKRIKGEQLNAKKENSCCIGDEARSN
ncbi:MAG: polysaccharide deacetylase family protein [Candidatus Omnitrophica bacterium]|nr:polysaccharide deacetylase family protein [Candidatus Omnitrophota bacterium]